MTETNGDTEKVVLGNKKHECSLQVCVCVLQSICIRSHNFFSGLFLCKSVYDQYCGLVIPMKGEKCHLV